MKSYVKEFNYPKKDGGTSKRRLLVLNENQSMFDGIELSYLDNASAEAAVEALKECDVKSFERSGTVIKNFNSDWNKAWRRYSKSKIIKDKEEANE